MSSEGTSADRVASLTMLVQLCPVFSTGYIKSLLNMAGRTTRSDSTMAMDALKELFQDTLLPDRKLKTLEQMDPVCLDAMALACQPKVAQGFEEGDLHRDLCGQLLRGQLHFRHKGWGCQDYLKTAYASFVQALTP